jgi:hypothetical protein
MISVPDLDKSFVRVIETKVSRGSAVGIATGYGLDDRGAEFESQWGQ